MNNTYTRINANYSTLLRACWFSCKMESTRSKKLQPTEDELLGDEGGIINGERMSKDVSLVNETNDIVSTHARCSVFDIFAKCKITVEPVLFLFMFSIYLYLSLIELYFYQKFGLKALKDANSTDMVPNNSFCVNSSLLDDVLGNGTNDEVEGQTSLLTLINSSPQYAISVVAALIAGPLSDKYGRKPALLFALIGNTFAATINILLVYFDMSIYYFLTSSLLMGVTGGFTITVTICYAYLSDVSSKRWLTLRISLLQAMFFISQALSDAITGQWLRRSGCDFSPILWLALSSSVLAILYLPFLKEPFTKAERIARLQESGHLKMSSLFSRGFKIFVSPKYSRWRLWFTAVIFAFVIINSTGLFEVLTLFQLHKPLEWGPSEIGWYGLSNTLVQVFSLFCILPILVYFKVPDALIALVGLLINSGLYFFIGFLSTTWEMYLGKYHNYTILDLNFKYCLLFLVGVLIGLDPTIVPILRSIFSKLVLQTDQGKTLTLFYITA